MKTHTYTLFFRGIGIGISLVLVWFCSTCERPLASTAFKLEQETTLVQLPLDPFASLKTQPMHPAFQSKQITSQSFPPLSSATLDLEAYSDITLAELTGPGKITHLWFAVENHAHKWSQLVLRMYWDEEKRPSVEVPLGDFFGIGMGLQKEMNSTPLVVTSAGRSRHCYFPMPFNNHARITLENQGASKIKDIYFCIDVQKLQHLPARTPYFHAHYHQATPCTLGVAYPLCFISGMGYFVGVVLHVKNTQGKPWDEGIERFFINHAREPALEGIGLDHYFGQAQGFTVLQHPYFGCNFHEGNFKGARSCVYRFHLMDPIGFSKSLRVTFDHGNKNIRTDYYYSVAYWYQLEPHRPFPQLPPFSRRLVSPPTVKEQAVIDASDAAWYYYGNRQWKMAIMAFMRMKEFFPEEPFPLYNLACVFALDGQAEQALYYLEQAYNKGFTDSSYLEQDVDFRSIRAHPRYQQLLDKMEGAIP
jgi:hypothetical protein